MKNVPRMDLGIIWPPPHLQWELDIKKMKKTQMKSVSLIYTKCYAALKCTVKLHNFEGKQEGSRDSDATPKIGLQIQFLMYHNNEQQTYLMNYFQKKLFKYHLQ